MDQADEELRETIKNIWPLQAKKMLDLLIPRNDGVYGLLLNYFIYTYVHLHAVYAGKVTSYSAVCKNWKYKYEGVYYVPAYIDLCFKIIQYICVVRAVETVKEEIC
jgi:hypothetical protein